jgi:hypothetical protein
MWNGGQPRRAPGTVRTSDVDRRRRDGVFDGEVMAIVDAVRCSGDVPERQELSAFTGPRGVAWWDRVRALSRKNVYARIVEWVRREDGLWPTTGMTTDVLPWAPTTG